MWDWRDPSSLGRSGFNLTGLIFTASILAGLEVLTFAGPEALVLKGLEGPRLTLRPGMAERVERRWGTER